MAYRLDSRLFVENGAAVTAAEAKARSSSRAFWAWRGLDPDGKLKAVDRALHCAANDSDGLPLAL
jgi:hypothetical protein